MGLPVMNPDGTGCCPPCTPVACAAEVVFQCNQDRRRKIICGFIALDGSRTRYADARVQWTGTSDASDTAGGPLDSDHCEVDFTAFFTANRIADYGENSPEENCSVTCDPALVEGTMTTDTIYNDATPDVSASNAPTCTGTSYSNPLYNLLDDEVIKRLDHGAPNAHFPGLACSQFEDYIRTSDPAPSGATYERTEENAIDFGAFDRNCEHHEAVTLTLNDEITYDELAEALLSEPLPDVTDDSTCIVSFGDAFFQRYDEDFIGAFPLGIWADYRPISFRFKRLTPATGAITVFYTVTTYFPDLATPLSEEEFTVQIDDGNDYSETRALEPDVYIPAYYPQGVYMILTAATAVPSC